MDVDSDSKDGACGGVLNADVTDHGRSLSGANMPLTVVMEASKYTQEFARHFLAARWKTRPSGVKI